MDIHKQKKERVVIISFLPILYFDLRQLYNLLQ